MVAGMAERQAEGKAGRLGGARCSLFTATQGSILLLSCPVQYNTLNDVLPKYDELYKRLLRSALMGWCSSFVSDICSNSIRVIKTSKQASTVPVTYTQIVKVRSGGGKRHYYYRSASLGISPASHPLTLRPMSPFLSVQTIVEKEGVQGLFLRGLTTKLITNGIQGILFSVLWRLGQVREEVGRGDV